MTGPLAILPGMSGLQAAALVRAAAHRRGITVNALLRTITRDAAKYLAQIERAERPTPRTLQRLAAIIDGRADPGPRVYERVHGPGAGRIVPLDLPKSGLVTVDRDPCFRCGTRGDLGCRHRPPGVAHAL